MTSPISSFFSKMWANFLSLSYRKDWEKFSGEDDARLGVEEGGGEDSGGIWPRERGSSAHIAAGGHCKMIMGATSVKCEKWLFALGWYRGTGKEVLWWLGVFTILPGLKKFIIHSSSDIGSFDQVEVEVDWWGVETTVGCLALAAQALSAGETMTMTTRRRPSCSRELLRGRRGQSVPTYPLLWETSDKVREKMNLRHFLIYIAANIIWYRAQFSIGWKTQSVGSKERKAIRGRCIFDTKAGCLSPSSV